MENMLIDAVGTKLKKQVTGAIDLEELKKENK
jgi:hypothetical protein